MRWWPRWPMQRAARPVWGQLQELEGKTNAWTDPITRNEVTAMATDLWPANGVIRCRRLLMRCWWSWPISSLRGWAHRELTQYVPGSCGVMPRTSRIALREACPMTIEELQEELRQAKGDLRAMSWVDWRGDINGKMVGYNHQLIKVERLQIELNKALKAEAGG